MYAIGDVVATSYDDRRQLGEVVGIAAMGQELLYDVSLEDVILKSVMEQDVHAASADDVRALLMTLLNAPQAGSTLRRAALRSSYVAFLTKALNALEGTATKDDSLAALYEVGQQVAMAYGSAWLLATVHGVRSTSDGLRYDVEAQGELQRVSEEALAPLDARVSPEGIALGERARFVAYGHENDDEFEGTVCAIEERKDSVAYALMFDDGDVLEDLSSKDLSLA